ncbi:hydroxymethylglutaryl-CoA lyase [Dehalococcoidia bacterium]|nr:hydroxymethylglutaryl-CoA lyase [Dehalococcoidia bacterium]
MELPKKAEIVEVGPRDGFQNEPVFIPTEQKIRILDQLSETGLRRIETTSFVHPKAIPQLANAAEVMAAIVRKERVRYMALIPNVKGIERALQAEVKEIDLVVSASESHNNNNLNMPIADSLQALREVARIALDNGMMIRGSIATAFGCPFEGWVPPQKVEEIVREYLAMGVYEIGLADTVGMANPLQVSQMVSRLREKFKGVEFCLHFHNTRGAGMANILAALDEGITIFDTSIGGLGGCPYAPGATGNIPTADVVHMLESMGIDTGIDLQKLVECAKMVQDLIGRELTGQVMKAGAVPWLIKKQAGR